MSRWILAAVAVMTCACALAQLAGPAIAQAGDGKEAHAHARRAKTYFDAGDYGRAAEEYQAAYDLDRKPSRIYNLAVCHDRAGDRERAMLLYRRYLELAPNGVAASVAAEAAKSIE